MASHRSLGDGAANGVANWVLPAQGFVDRRSDLGTPHLCIRMRGGLTPTRRNPDTSCRSPMRPASGKTKRSATVRITGPFRSTRNRWEDRIARRAVLREARPAMRAAFRRRSRKEPAWTAPEVPSISGDPVTSTVSPRPRTGPTPKRGSQDRALCQLGSSLRWLGFPDTFGTGSRTRPGRAASRHRLSSTQ